jgi:hypothetical protein
MIAQQSHGTPASQDEVVFSQFPTSANPGTETAVFPHRIAATRLKAAQVAAMAGRVLTVSPRVNRKLPELSRPSSNTKLPGQRRPIPA